MPYLLNRCTFIFLIFVQFGPTAKSIPFELFTLLPTRCLLTLNDLNLIRCWKSIIEHIEIVPEDIVRLNLE